MKDTNDDKDWLVRTQMYVQKSSLHFQGFPWNTQKIIDLFNRSHTVTQPLSYDTVTKDVKVLRDGSKEQRAVTRKYNLTVKNRRFAIVYLLAKCAEVGKDLNFETFYKELLSEKNTNPDGTPYFVINRKNFRHLLMEEMPIAILSGIPYELNGGTMRPLTKLKMSAVTKGAPKSLISKLDEIFKKVAVKRR